MRATKDCLPLVCQMAITYSSNWKHWVKNQLEHCKGDLRRGWRPCPVFPPKNPPPLLVTSVGQPSSAAVSVGSRYGFHPNYEELGSPQRHRAGCWWCRWKCAWQCQSLSPADFGTPSRENVRLAPLVERNTYQMPTLTGIP